MRNFLKIPVRMPVLMIAVGMVRQYLIPNIFWKIMI